MSKMITTRLKDGRELVAYCVLVSSSDRGALMFMPSDRATRNFIAKAREDAKALFGNKPVILVAPRMTYDDKNQPWLPPVRLIAEFHSRPFDEQSHISSAVVIWYQHEATPFIGADIADDFGGIDWQKEAANESLL